MTFQNSAAHEHVHNLFAHVGSESPKTLCLPDGQPEARHFLELGADTDSELLNIHLYYAFLQLMDGLLTRSWQTNRPGLSNEYAVKNLRNRGK